MSDETIGKDQERSGINRRTVMKGAAWSVPVIMVATSAPAIAQSRPIEPSFTPGTFCKHPGEPKWYHAVFCFKNSTLANITVTVDNLDINGVVRDARVSIGGALADDFVVNAGTTRCMYVDAGLYSNSANGSAILSFHYTYNSVVYNETISGGFIADASLPPCGTGADPTNQPKQDPPHATSGP